MAILTKIFQVPDTQDLEWWQGDDFEFDVMFTDDSLVAVDLSGYTFKAEVRAQAGALIAYAATIDTVLAASGIITVVFDKATSALMPENGVWDLQITSPAGKRTTELHGAVTVTREVTV